MKDEREEIDRDEDQEALQADLDNSDDFFDHEEIVIDAKQEPLRIDKFLMDRLARISRNRIQNGIKAGSVLVDGKEIKPNYKIKPGNVISITVPRSANDGGDAIVPEEMPLDIRYEDEDLLIVFKPPGMVVHPGVGNYSGTLVNGLAHYLDLDKIPVTDGNYQDRVGLVHRIDKNTSGLLVVAKNDYTLTHLAKQFFNHTIERTYYALVWGEPEQDRGTITGHVGRHPRFRQNYTVFPEGDQGKWAVTHYEVMERLYYVSLVKCNLETGRTHQIRVHMKHIGHPLFNDDRYGGDEIVKGTVFSKYKLFVGQAFNVLPRQALHAKSLGFVHPRTGEFMHFDSDLPTDMQDALDLWRRYVEGRRAAVGDKGLG
ncbi:MAG: RluA family pseudouridine synthase [Lewinellaceae bacterium]|nr:RluA family pseudouridine synthase [Lewinellaceae bacterium]